VSEGIIGCFVDACTPPVTAVRCGPGGRCAVRTSSDVASGRTKTPNGVGHVVEKL
jgi:hypothetical protein